MTGWKDLSSADPAKQPIARAGTRKPPVFHGYRIVVASVAAATFSPATLVNVPFGLFITELQESFGWSRAEVSLSLTIFIATLVATLPIMGHLIDRFGVRRTALASIPSYVVALMSMSFMTGSLLHLYFVFALISALSVGAQSLTFIKLLSAWFDRRRGLMIGIYMAGFGIGYILIPLASRLLIDVYGWRMAYVALGAMALIGTWPAIYLLVRNTPQDMGLEVDGAPAAPSAPATAPTGDTLRDAARTREFWLLAVTFVLVSFSLNGVQSQIVPLLLDDGMSTATATMMLSAIGLGSFPGRVVAGYLMDRLFAPYVVVVFYAMSILGVIVLVGGGPPFLVFLSAVAVGVSLGAENDALGYMTSRYFGLRHFGQIYSVLLCCYLTGAAAGPYFMARAYDETGSYDSVLVAGMWAIAASCVLLLFLRRYQIGVAPPLALDEFPNHSKRHTRRGT